VSSVMAAEFSVSWSVVADSSFAVRTDNFVQIQEFHGCTEGVADSAAEKASAEAGSHAGIRWNPGKGHFPWGRGAALSRRTGYSDSAKVQPAYDELWG